METNRNSSSAVPAKPQIAPIAVIGDLIIDEFVEAVPEPSIETPAAPIFVAQRVTTLAGGAALVAQAAAKYSAGRDVYLVSSSAPANLSLAPRVSLRSVDTAIGYPRKTRVYSPAGNFRIDHDDRFVWVRPGDPDAPLDLTLPRAEWSRGGCVVLADYRWLLDDAFEYASPALREVFDSKPSYLVIDPHRTRSVEEVGALLDGVPEGTTVVLKVNDALWSAWLLKAESHAADLMPDYWDEESLLEYLFAVQDARSCYLWVTRGDRPGLLYKVFHGGYDGPKELPLPEVPGEFVSAVGAGDVATAALAVGLASGLGVEAACRFGHAAATLKTRYRYTRFPKWSKVAGYFPGTRSVARTEAADGVMRYDAPPGLGALKPLHLTHDRELIAQCLRTLLKLDEPAEARPGGPLVANGVFDGLHAGHQRVLTHCKQGREVLVVGLNSDESVAKLGRTTFASCEERARAIAQLRGVDLIVTYDEETPDALYDLVRQVAGGPITIVKGEEYADEAQAGTLQGVQPGDHVRLIPQIPGLSSTGIRKLIKSAPVNGEKPSCDRLCGCARR